MSNWSAKIKDFRRIAPVLLGGGLFLLSSHWLAVALFDETHHFTDWCKLLEMWWQMLLIITLMLGSSFWLYNHRHRYLPVRSLSRRVGGERSYTTIILTISPPNVMPVLLPGPSVSFMVKGITLGNKTLREDIELLNGTGWNWQQILRAFREIRPEKLQRIYLIGSRDDMTDPANPRNGSFQSLEICKQLLQMYFPHTVIEIWSKPVDFEELEDLMPAILTIVHREKEKRVAEHEMVIDVTGGQKTASIAAALVTLHNKLTFQYVQTNPPFQAITYDVVTESYFSLPE